MILIPKSAQVLALLPFFVAVEARLLEFVVRDGVLHAVDDELDPLLDLSDLLRQSGLAQFHASPSFVDEVDCLIGQKAVGNITVGMRNREIDRILRVTYSMKFLVAVLDAAQDLLGILFVRRRHFDGLEAALQRAILFDRFAVFSGRGRADALNLATRESRLQNVGRVERALGRTGAHQRVQLVDEDDAVLRLHQLLHDGLEPLLELAAILCPGDDQGKIESQDALVRQERRDLAIGDALRQAFHNRGLAYAGLANQHRVVLGPAAKDLNRPVDFLVATDQRIELIIHGRLREIARELGEQRRLAVALRLGLHLLLRRALHFLADGLQLQSALVQNLGGKAFFFPQKSQQEVFGADVLVRKTLGLLGRIGEHTLAFIAQRQIDTGRNLFADRGVPLDLLADGVHRRMLPKETIGQSLILAQQAKQQVLRFDVGRPKLACFIACEKNHASGFFGVPFKHLASPQLPRSCCLPVALSRPYDPEPEPCPTLIVVLSCRLRSNK